MTSTESSMKGSFRLEGRFTKRSVPLDWMEFGTIHNLKLISKRLLKYYVVTLPFGTVGKWNKIENLGTRFKNKLSTISSQS